MSNVFQSLMSPSLFTFNPEVQAALAQVNFDFSVIKIDPPKSYYGVGEVMSRKRRNDAESGTPHVTIRRLKALFRNKIPDTPLLLDAYGTRASEIARHDSTNLRGEAKKTYGVFEEFVGSDATTVWAAATSGKEAIAIHLLACMIARVWSVAEAASIWVEIVQAQKDEIQKKHEQGSEDLTAFLASLPEVDRGALAELDNSARAWIRRGDDVQTLRQKQVQLIIDNIDIAVSVSDSLFRNVLEGWSTALVGMEALLRGESQRVNSGGLALALTCWHLYPDLELPGGNSVVQKDPLFERKGEVILELEASPAQESRGVSWCLSLSKLRFYGAPVVSEQRFNLDTSRLTLEQLKFVVLGCLTNGWVQGGSNLERACGLIVKLHERVFDGRDTIMQMPWLPALSGVAKTYLTTKNNTESTLIQKLINLGRRQGQSLLGAPENHPSLFFGLVESNKFISLITDVQDQVDLLRSVAKRSFPNAAPGDVIIRYMDHFPEFEESDAYNPPPDYQSAVNVVSQQVQPTRRPSLQVDAKTVLDTLETAEGEVVAVEKELLKVMLQNELNKPLITELLKEAESYSLDLTEASLTTELTAKLEELLDTVTWPVFVVSPVDKPVDVDHVYTGSGTLKVDSLKVWHSIAENIFAIQQQRQKQPRRPSTLRQQGSALSSSDLLTVPKDPIRSLEQQLDGLSMDPADRRCINFTTAFPTRDGYHDRWTVAHSAGEHHGGELINVAEIIQLDEHGESEAGHMKDNEQVHSLSVADLSLLKGMHSTKTWQFPNGSPFDMQKVKTESVEYIWFAGDLESSAIFVKSSVLRAAEKRKSKSFWISKQMPLEKKIRAEDVEAAFDDDKLDLDGLQRALITTVGGINKNNRSWEFWRSLAALAFLDSIYQRLGDATIDPAVIAKPLSSGRWFANKQNLSFQDLSPTRAEAFACIGYLEAGLDSEIHTYKNVMAISSGDSIYVAAALLEDPLLRPRNGMVKRILGNVGKPGVALLVPPPNPECLKLKPTDWNLFDIEPFSGVLKDSFASTTLHMSFTGWTAPALMRHTPTGLPLIEAHLVETVISLHSMGKWIADLDILDALSKGSGSWDHEWYYKCGCDHMPSSSAPDDVEFLSINNWEAFLDQPEGPVIVMTHKNWLARLSVVALAVRRRDRVVLGQGICWQCYEDLYSLGGPEIMKRTVFVA